MVGHFLLLSLYSYEIYEWKIDTISELLDLEIYIAEYIKKFSLWRGEEIFLNILN